MNPLPAGNPQQFCFCRNAAWRPAAKYLSKWGEVSLLQCTQCRVHRAAVLPSENDISSLYREDHIYKAPSDETFQVSKQGFAHVRRDLERLGFQEGSLLEIGCNAGYALSLFQDHGWRVTGVELNQATAAAARARLGVTVYDDLEAIPSSELHDVVLLSHVLEHVVHPVEFLHKLVSHLNHSGVVCVKVPNYGSLTVRYILRDNWAAFLPFQHVWYFDQKSLRRLLSILNFRTVCLYSRERLGFRASHWAKTFLKVPFVIASHLVPYDGGELVGIFARSQ